MLGKLVNKFKRQTLQDGNGTVDADGCSSPPAQVSPPMGTRRSARLNEKAEKEKGGGNGNGDGISVPGNNSCLPPNSPSPPNTRSRRAQLLLAATSHELLDQQYQQQRKRGGGQMTRTTSCVTTRTMTAQTLVPPICDSGRESDDDELEMLDSLSNASRGDNIMMGIGRSPPTLTSSPPLISEFETSSWDSCGCESGIVLRDSAERDDASRNLDLMEAAFGGGELVMEINNNKKNAAGRAANTTVVDGQTFGGTTPIQSKDAFPPAYFLRSNASHPMPIDFSILRHAELSNSAANCADLFSSASSTTLGNHREDMANTVVDDVPTPIGSQKEPGPGAVLMELAQLEKQQPAQHQQQQQSEQQPHQGAFRRVLRRTRRNSNSQQQQQQPAAAARTVSPLGAGLGEKRRWDAPAAATTGGGTIAATTSPLPEHQHQQQQPIAAGLLDHLEAVETLPIAARTRNSLLLGLMGGGAAGGGPGAAVHPVDNSNGADASAFPRLVLTAARRTRVRVLYSAGHGAVGGGGSGGSTGGAFMVPTVGMAPHGGRRGQVAPMLGQSPPNMLVANKRGRHCSKSSNSPPRPSLNFDKMRKRMLSNSSTGSGNGGANLTTTGGANGGLDGPTSGEEESAELE